MSGNEAKGYFPSRPALTVVFLCAIAFWASCGAAYTTGDVRDAEACRGLVAVAAALAVSGAVLAVRSRSAISGLVVASAAVGLALGCVHAAHVHDVASRLEETPRQHAELVLLEDSVDKGFGETALVGGRIGDCEAAVFSARFDSGTPLLCGQRIRGEARYSPADYGEDPYSWRQGSCGRLVVEDCGEIDAAPPLSWLLSLRSDVIRLIGAQDVDHALLQALVCGYRRNIDGTELYAQFQACGLAHLVAVSGAHLVIVTGLLASLLKRLQVPRRVSVGLLVAVMGSYYIIAGMPVSALRATVMSALGLMSYFGRRRASSLNALGIGIFAMLALSPETSVSASFALSSLSTMGIILFAPLFHAWLEKTPLVHADFVIDALSLTASAGALSQLYACSLFNQLPLVAPLANVASAPLFPIACGAGLVAGMAAVAFPALAAPLSGIPVLVSGALSGLVGVLAAIPHASVPFTLDTGLALVLSAAFAFLIWALWPRPDWKCLAVCLAPALVAALAGVGLVDGGRDAIIALDVGQGDAILVESRGQRYLVDTGNQDSKLLEELARNHVAHLDGVVISHADDDHCGSIDALKRAVSVDRFVLASGMLDCRADSARSLVSQARGCTSSIIGVEVGDSFQVGAFTARVVWPREFTEDGGNADSLCILLDYDGDDDGEVDFRALLTGDAETDELAEMISSGAVGDVDILKVGHHGSRNGSTPDQMAALDPEIALISCGARNRYGHPAQEILDQLASVGAATHRTDQDGEIRCTLTPEKVLVSHI